MSSITVNCGNIEISNDKKICIIAGPCQLETEQHAMDMAGEIKEITSKYGLGFIYKGFTGSNSEIQVKKVFWHETRYVHGMFYVLAAFYLSKNNVNISSLLLLSDLIFSFLYRFILQR